MLLNFDILVFFFFQATTMSLVNVSLEKVYIYFDTATFDEIERDEKVISEAWLNNSDLKVTMEAQLGLIGGTMGLLTGFSILSAVEIIYYLFRCFFGCLNHSLNFQVFLVPQDPRS